MRLLFFKYLYFNRLWFVIYIAVLFLIARVFKKIGDFKIKTISLSSENQKNETSVPIL